MFDEVVIAIPTLNEAVHIGAVVSHFTRDAPGATIVVSDGGSTDGTWEIARDLAARHAKVHVLHNPDRMQAEGVNRVERWARGKGFRFLLRVDAHARYPDGFARGVLCTLHNTAADSIVVPLLAHANSGWAGANACLQRSPLGHGNARHRLGAHEGPVDHGHHAGFRLSAFRAIGGYDKGLAAAEDVDLDHRLKTNGGRIIMTSRWPIEYVPRATVRGVWQQFRRNGYWRARVWQKHGAPPGPRQLAPCLAVAGSAAGVLVAPVLPMAMVFPVTYLGLLAGLAILAARGRPPLALRVAWLALVTHTAYATGVARASLRPWPRPTRQWVRP